MRTAHSALGFEGCWGCWGIVGRRGALRLRCSAGMLRLVVGVGDLCGQMGRLVMILNWLLRGVIFFLFPEESASSRSNCFAQLCL